MADAQGLEPAGRGGGDGTSHREAEEDEEQQRLFVVNAKDVTRRFGDSASLGATGTRPVCDCRPSFRLHRPLPDGCAVL